MLVTASRATAVLQAREGFHNLALKNLENITPLIRYVQPKVYFDYLNSYAVELGEAGRIEEALKVCQITLASPFINAYPEWRETGQDLALRGYKSRSLVPIIQSFPGNVAQLPQREPSEPHEPSATSIQSKIFGPAPVFSLKEWKDKMVKEPNGDDEKLPEKVPDGMSVREMAMMLLEVITQNKDEEAKLRQVLNYALEVFSKPKK